MNDRATPGGEEAAPDGSEQGRDRRWPAALRALEHRDFRRFWSGLVISVMGTWMQMTAQGWLVYILTDSPLYLGIVGACATVPVFLFSLPAGVIADRVSKRNILLITQSLAMTQAFILSALVYTDAVKIWHVMALAGCLGVVNAFDMPTRHAMVIELASREDVLNAVSLNSSAFNTGRIVGPAVAGLLLAKVGIAPCFFINGFTFIALIAALVTIAPRKRHSAMAGPMRQHISEGLRWLRGQPTARGLLAMIAVTSIFAMPHATLLPVFARDVFRVGPQGLGFMMSAYAVGALSSALTLTAVGHRWRLGRLVTAGSLLFPVALMSVALSPRFAMIVGSLFVTGLGMMLFNAVANTILQKAPPDELRGRVMSLRTLVFAGMMPLGNLQMGALGEWFGPRVALATGAALCLIAATVAWWRLPGLREAD